MHEQGQVMACPEQILASAFLERGCHLLKMTSHFIKLRSPFNKMGSHRKKLGDHFLSMAC